MDKLVAVHPPSRPHAFTTTSDGRWLYQSEGGTITFIHTWDGNDYSNAEFVKHDGGKRVTVGSRGVLASRMILDPDSGLPPLDLATHPADLLYIAGGRDGLWVMEADTDTNYTDNKSWRVDDSGNNTDLIQFNRRWCCDVNTMKVDGKQYLLALFTKKSQSRLRVYELSKVRAIANPANSEKGNEINADLQVKLDDNPNEIQSPPLPDPQFGRSVAVAMAVDQQGTGTAGEGADVYVAMGHHGLVKVSFAPPPLGTGPPVATTTWGPLFGDRAPVPVQSSGMSNAVYGNLKLVENRPHLGEVRVERSEYPFFTDVAVFQGTVGGVAFHQLFVAVDHLFWLTYDLDVPFGPTMPILHHHGQETDVVTYVDATGTALAWQKAVQPLSATAARAGCARDLELVQHSSGKTYLVVSSAISLLKDYAIYTTEGIAYDAKLGFGGGSGDLPAVGRKVYVYELYRQAPQGTDIIAYRDPEILEDTGGYQIHVPAQQELTGELKVFHNLRAPDPDDEGRIKPWGVCLTRVDISGSSSHSSLVRSVSNYAGRLTQSIGASILNPNLVFTSDNDGGVQKDGFLATDPTGAFLRHYTPPPLGEPQEQNDGVGGLLFRPESQWLHPTIPDEQYVWCVGVDPSPEIGEDWEGKHQRWMHLRLQVPSDLVNNAPVRQDYWYAVPPPDGFQNRGRDAMFEAYMNPVFDAHLQSVG
ncbi:MAG: hypothetical protein ACE5EL_05010, partial [Anaerolineae bacterium]